MNRLYLEMIVAAVIVAVAAAAWVLSASVSGALVACRVSVYNLSLSGNLSLEVAGVELKVEEGAGSNLRVKTCGLCNPIVEARGDTLRIGVEQEIPLVPVCRVEAELSIPRLRWLGVEARGASVALREIRVDVLKVDAAGAAINGKVYVDERLEIAASGSSVTLEARMPPNATGRITGSGATVTLMLDTDARIHVGAEASLAGASIATPDCRGERGPTIVIGDAADASIIVQCKPRRETL